MKKISESMPTLLIKTPFKGRGLNESIVNIPILTFRGVRYRPLIILTIGRGWDNDALLAGLVAARYEDGLPINDRVIDRCISRSFRESNQSA